MHSEKRLSSAPRTKNKMKHKKFRKVRQSENENKKSIARKKEKLNCKYVSFFDERFAGERSRLHGILPPSSATKPKADSGNLIRKADF